MKISFFENRIVWENKPPETFSSPKNAPEVKPSGAKDREALSAAVVAPPTYYEDVINEASTYDETAAISGKKIIPNDQPLFQKIKAVLDKTLEKNLIRSNKILYQTFKILEDNFEEVTSIVNRVYNKSSTDEVLVRNLLPVAWLNEQARGWSRLFRKELGVHTEEIIDQISQGMYNLRNIPSTTSEIWGSLFTDDESPSSRISTPDLWSATIGKRYDKVKSRGQFQLRVTDEDLAFSKKKFEENGLTMPATAPALKAMVEENLLAATIVAGERLRNELHNFKRTLDANDEVIDPRNGDFAIMLLTSYNRGTNAIKRASLQNWAIKLATVLGLNEERDKLIMEFDAKRNKERTAEDMMQTVVDTFRIACQKLILNGDINYPGHLNSELQKLYNYSSINEFIEGLLFYQIQTWYTKQTGSKLSFILTESDRSVGDKVFSYGVRIIKDDANWKKNYRE